ncbi:MAG: methyltransferase domain-containing protein [Alphaproteobacteria bacterium]|nr:methyltransferase domain-containing protein [Alphaproteobacteria bacterium]
MTQSKAAGSLASHLGQAKSSPEDERTDVSLLSHVSDNPLLKNIPAKIIRRAWFAMAHLIMKDGDTIIDMGCQNGQQTYAMAAQHPNISFTGVDKNEQDIKYAKENYKLPNLKFMCADIETDFLPENSADAIINSFTLHEIYSAHKCNDRFVAETIEKQFKILKQGGQFFIQGHILSSDDEYVLMEMIEEKSKGQNIEELSEIQLLSLYAEQARPHEEENYRGFYLEELPARFPRTRLFRLPAKWAYEFIIRKDQRARWNEDLSKEYIFFNRGDFDRIIKSLGARMVYSAPHWNQEVIKKSLDKKIKLFSENGNPIDAPPTSFAILAQKTPERSSLSVHERKPSKNEETGLTLMAMRNDTNGHTRDIVSRGLEVAEIIPYLVTEDERLHIFVHEEVPRALLNTIRRNGPNLDGKQWSGHMCEALAIPLDKMEKLDRSRFRDILNFSRENLDLTPKMGSIFEEGPGFYPAPDSIDEHIDTLYLNVEAPKTSKTKQIIPKIVMEDADGFSGKGFLKEVDAQQILDAIAVGLIPSSRLEVQLLCLYEQLGIKYKSWVECPLDIQTGEVEKVTKIQEIIAKLSEDDHRFKEVKGSAGQIRAMQSIFVDEGQENGSATGLASRNVDFIINEESSMNMAVVLPLSKSVNGEVMAGIVEEYLPVPQRYKGNGYTITCPSFSLPKEIENFQMALKYIADQFEVPTECVARMGEGYFSYIGLTPQRVYPFAVTTPGASGWLAKGRGHGVTSVTPLYNLGRLLYWDNHDSFLEVVARTYQSTIGLDSSLSAGTSFSKQHAAGKSVFSSSPASSSSSSTNSSSSKKYDR